MNRGLCPACIGRREKGKDGLPTLAVLQQVLFLTDLVITMQDELAATRREVKDLQGRLELAARAPKTPYNTAANRRSSTSTGGAAAVPFCLQSGRETPRKRPADDHDESQAKMSRSNQGRPPPMGGVPAAEKRPRPRLPATRCTGTEGGLIPAAPARAEYPDRVLVSRVALGVSPETILEYAYNLSRNVISVVKMKTRSTEPSYASFIVEVPKGEGSLIDDPSKWSAGITVKTFFGQPRPDQIDEKVIAKASEPQTEPVDARAAAETFMETFMEAGAGDS